MAQRKISGIPISENVWNEYLKISEDFRNAEK